MAKEPTRAGELLFASELRVSTRQLKRAEAVEIVRTAREDDRQRVAFSSRYFVLCGLPLKRPPATELEHIRRNGDMVLSVTGHPRFGLPFGQDRLLPIWAATVAMRSSSRTITFRSGAEILDMFGLPKDGKTYRRLVEGFKRLGTSTMFFGREEQLEHGLHFQLGRFHFFDSLNLWYTRHLDQTTLPGEEFENRVQLSELFWKELQEHPIPIDLNVVRGLSDSPGCLDFYLWLCWRCWNAKKSSSIPLFGAAGLVNQLGVRGYEERWKFRQTLRRWLIITRRLWPACPAEISQDGNALVVQHGRAISAR